MYQTPPSLSAASLAESEWPNGIPQGQRGPAGCRLADEEFYKFIAITCNNPFNSIYNLY
ncbi:hypothetical protein PENSUB_2067 [Penicillium subrubescens]|jgi:predicted pyridoxine 5'-phosphate oxidase superfamily flavin-nucleotide-binding protein|uniref:Uncharacterized protein n=1 Tax=Penicillium subrubescens TaxID=1316194 RepID=A0A1Q5UIP2_9EURO|nr:hypothetical protein PENSUB_2067 [Penicillium subrubescens]